LEHGAAAYRCLACKAEYSIVHGIADFRPPDMRSVYFDDPKDYEPVVKELDLYPFAELEVRAFGAKTEFQYAYLKAAVQRGDDHWSEAEMLAGGSPVQSRRAALDIGCSTGGNLVALAKRFEVVVGVEVTLKAILVGRKRLEEAGLNERVFMVAASAEALPFRPDTFDYVTAMNVIEHVNDQPVTLSEAHRVLRRGGSFFFDSPNRFTLLPEPHVKLWGVGFLPRAWADPYVRFRLGYGYEGKRLLSLLELRKFLRRNFGGNVTIGVPSFEERAYFPEGRLKKAARIAFNGVFRKTPVLRDVLYPFVPTYNVMARK
jgi:SAM-dependent methyltransferase